MMQTRCVHLCVHTWEQVNQYEYLVDECSFTPSGAQAQRWKEKQERKQVDRDCDSSEEDTTQKAQLSVMVTVVAVVKK